MDNGEMIDVIMVEMMDELMVNNNGGIHVIWFDGFK